MNQILVSSSGSYPRIGRGSEGHNLRHAWHAYDQGKLDLTEVKVIEDRVAREVLKEQEDSGADIVTDGLVRWYCPVSQIAGKMYGVEKGALHHFLDTNFHVRKAVIKDLPRRETPFIVEEVRLAKAYAAKEIKAVLTGPSTLLRYSENHTQYSRERIGEAYTEALAQEIDDLIKEGVRWIQIDDPCLLEEKKENWPDYASWYKIIKRASPNSYLELKTYGKSARGLLDYLFSLPVDYLGLDCVSNPQIIQELQANPAWLSAKGVALGIVDSKTKKIENPQYLVQLVEPLLRNKIIKYPILLEPAYGLEFTARRYAKEKLRSLAKTKEILSEKIL